MKHSSVLCLVVSAFIVAPALAQPGPTEIEPGASFVTVDGRRHRVPPTATHYRAVPNPDGRDGVRFMRRTTRPNATGIVGRLEDPTTRANGTHTTEHEVSTPPPGWVCDDTGCRPVSNTTADKGLKFMEWKPVQTRSGRSWGPVLTDIVNHLPRSYGNTYDDANRITFGHETTHGINSHLRNHKNDTGERVNGFYVLEDRGVLVPEPNMRKSRVAALVPPSLRGSRYGTYVTGSRAWDDTPTYLLDEWVAYVNGGTVGVDLVKRGQWNEGWQDGVMGQLEFTVYAFALAMAVERHDPSYWKTKPQLRRFIAWNARRSMEVYTKGAKLPAFRWDKQDRYLETLRSGGDAERMRQWVRKTYGEDWAKDVMGF